MACFFTCRYILLYSGWRARERFSWLPWKISLDNPQQTPLADVRYALFGLLQIVISRFGIQIGICTPVLLAAVLAQLGGEQVQLGIAQVIAGIKDELFGLGVVL